MSASLADTGELLHTRLRGGNATSGRGAATFVAETISRVRGRRCSGWDHLAGRLEVLRRRGGLGVPPRRVRFSITASMNTAIRKAIAAIPDEAWTAIPYWIDGGADVAETT